MAHQSHTNNPPVERTQDDFFPVVQISPVPVDIPISQVLTDISSYIRDVIGAMRVADYRAKRLGETVFLYCINHTSAQMLENVRLEYNNQQIIPIVVPMKVGRASFIDKNFECSFHGVPISIILKGIERQRETTIYYLIELVKYFEKKGVVTGVRLGFNEKRNWSTTQGYMTFLRQADAKSLSGEGCYVEHMIQGRKVRAALSENIPMLVSHEDLHRFENGIINWSEEAEAINQLVMTFQFPMHLAEHQTIDNRALVKKLHKKYENVEFKKYSSDYTRKNIHVPFPNPAKRTKLLDSEEPPAKVNKTLSKDVPVAVQPPKAAANKSTVVEEVRDSPESPFEDIVSDSDEDILRIDLEENTVDE